jgi:hypothetical protein
LLYACQRRVDVGEIDGVLHFTIHIVEIIFAGRIGKAGFGMEDLVFGEGRVAESEVGAGPGPETGRRGEGG